MEDLEYRESLRIKPLASFYDYFLQIKNSKSNLIPDVKRLTKYNGLKLSVLEFIEKYKTQKNTQKIDDKFIQDLNIVFSKFNNKNFENDIYNYLVDFLVEILHPTEIKTFFKIMFDFRVKFKVYNIYDIAYDLYKSIIDLINKIEKTPDEFLKYYDDVFNIEFKINDEINSLREIKTSNHFITLIIEISVYFQNQLYLIDENYYEKYYNFFLKYIKLTLSNGDSFAMFYLHLKYGTKIEFDRYLDDDVRKMMLKTFLNDYDRPTNKNSIAKFNIVENNEKNFYFIKEIYKKFDDVALDYLEVETDFWYKTITALYDVYTIFQYPDKKDFLYYLFEPYKEGKIELKKHHIKSIFKNFNDYCKELNIKYDVSSYIDLIL